MVEESDGKEIFMLMAASMRCMPISNCILQRKVKGVLMSFAKQFGNLSLLSISIDVYRKVVSKLLTCAVCDCL